MGSVLNIVAACADLKRAAPTASLRLRAHRRGPDRAKRWVAALRDAKPTTPAGELYLGSHWTMCRDVPAAALAMGWKEAHLWVASAGYGLIPAGRLVSAYSATFAVGNADSVSSAASGAGVSLDRRAWWRAVCSKQRSIASLAANGASLLFIGSPAYVDAAHEDLEVAVSVAKNSRRVVVVTSRGASDGLADQVVLSTGPMRTDLGGAMTSLNARLAHRVAGTLTPREWSVDAARTIAAEVESSAPLIEPLVRAPVTDEEARAFIRRELRAVDRPSASKFLRRLRDAGHACEQKRFGRLFRQESA